MQRNSGPHSGPNQPAAAQTVNTKRESLLPCPQTSATALSATGVVAICSLAGSAACNTASITASIFGQSDAPHAAAHQGKRGRAQRGAGRSDAGGAGCTDGDKADRHAIAARAKVSEASKVLAFDSASCMCARMTLAPSSPGWSVGILSSDTEVTAAADNSRLCLDSVWACATVVLRPSSPGYGIGQIVELSSDFGQMVSLGFRFRLGHHGKRQDFARNGHSIDAASACSASQCGL